MDPVVIRSGLVDLVHRVRAYFAEHAVTAHVSLGWKERTKQSNQGAGRANRVVFTPSDDSGRGGKILGAHLPGPRAFGSPLTDVAVRSLANWERYIVVSIWAADAQHAHDEERQIEAVESLFEWTMRAVHATAYAAAVWGDTSWTVSPVEHSFGRELRAPLVFAHPIFDVPAPIVRPTPAIRRGDRT